jgi:hypothetical protein
VFRGRSARSRGYKLVGRGCPDQVPCGVVWSIEGLAGVQQTLVTVSLLSFIVTRGGARGGSKKEVQCWVAGTSRRTSLSARVH